MQNDYAYDDYDLNPDPSHRPLYLKKLLRRLSTEQNIKTILDSGCGGGDFAAGLAEAGYSVYGVDLSPSGIKAACARNVGQFKLSSMYENLTEPFDVKSFDCIVAIETIEHLYSPRLFIKQAKQALRPGGLLVITTPYWGYLKNIARSLSNRTDRALSALWDGGHIKHWSRATLTELLAEQGFEVDGFYGCGVGIQAYTPFLWNEMMMIFRRL